MGAALTQDGIPVESFLTGYSDEMRSGAVEAGQGALPVRGFEAAARLASRMAGASAL